MFYTACRIFARNTDPKKAIYCDMGRDPLRLPLCMDNSEIQPGYEIGFKGCFIHDKNDQVFIQI